MGTDRWSMTETGRRGGGEGRWGGGRRWEWWGNGGVEGWRGEWEMEEGGDGGEWDRKGAREGEAREIEGMQRVKGAGGMKLHLLFHHLLAQ